MTSTIKHNALHQRQIDEMLRTLEEGPALSFVFAYEVPYDHRCAAAEHAREQYQLWVRSHVLGQLRVMFGIPDVPTKYVARCECYNSHGFPSGRCQVRNVRDPIAATSGGEALCPSCREVCATGFAPTV